MTSYSRLILPLVTAAAIAVVVPVTSPVGAADAGVVGAPVAKTPVAKTQIVKTEPTVIKHHRWRRTWIAYRHHRHVAPAAPVVASHLGCSGAWCGRQYVLMIGIGY